MPDILKDGQLSIEGQQELLNYMDKRLEQIELLLFRMYALAHQAAADITDAERENFQNRIEQLKAEIDKIAAELAVPAI